jgi:hypothetical protein
VTTLERQPQLDATTSSKLGWPRHGCGCVYVNIDRPLDEKTPLDGEGAPPPWSTTAPQPHNPTTLVCLYTLALLFLPLCTHPHTFTTTPLDPPTMPPPDVPSPTPSNMPPPPTKRPRQTAAAASTGAGAGAGGGASTPGGASATGGGAPRVKRRKPEGSVGPDSTDGKDARKQAFGVGMVKGKEDEFAEDKDIQTRVSSTTVVVTAAQG